VWLGFVIKTVAAVVVVVAVVVYIKATFLTHVTNRGGRGSSKTVLSN
jgi:hypothetical protein